VVSTEITQPTRAVRAVYEPPDDHATTRTPHSSQTSNGRPVVRLVWRPSGRPGGEEAAKPTVSPEEDEGGEAASAPTGRQHKTRHQETAGRPAVSSPWSDPTRSDYFQR
jgi:hypothetical protein